MKGHWKIVLTVIITYLIFITMIQGNSVFFQIAKQKAFESTQTSEWNCMQGKYCVVYFKESPEEAAVIMRTADVYYPLVAADFKWNRAEKPIFVVYHDKNKMIRALGLQENTPVPMGAYSMGRIYVLSPSLWAGEDGAKRTDTFLEKGPVAHELVHFAMDDTVKGEYPLWFAEGVALYYENKYTGFEWRIDLKEKSEYLDAKLLETNFGQLPVELAYRKSYDIVKDYVKVYGEKGLQSYISSLTNADK